MKVLRFELLDTPTYRHRFYQWMPGVGSGDGLLLVTLTYRKGKKSAESDLYGVEEVPSGSLGVRVFQFVSLNDTEQERPYTTSVGGVERCSCSAGRMCPDGTSCKHIDAIRHLIEAGAMPERPILGAF